jgi:hypothetical protein
LLKRRALHLRRSLQDDFLSNLRDEEVETLNAIRTVGIFMKWVIVGFLGFIVGLVVGAEDRRMVPAAAVTA